MHIWMIAFMLAMLIVQLTNQFWQNDHRSIHLYHTETLQLFSDDEINDELRKEYNDNDDG